MMISYCKIILKTTKKNSKEENIECDGTCTQNIKKNKQTKNMKTNLYRKLLYRTREIKIEKQFTF